MEEEFIIEVLDLFKSKLKNKKCTKQQTDAVYKVMTENMDIFATADEIAQHYGKSRDAVHSVIKNKVWAGGLGFDGPRDNPHLSACRAAGRDGSIRRAVRVPRRSYFAGNQRYSLRAVLPALQ